MMERYQLKKAFPVGCRVVLNKYGEKLKVSQDRTGKAVRTGKVVGYGQGGPYIRILRDGRKAEGTYHYQSWRRVKGK